VYGVEKHPACWSTHVHTGMVAAMGVGSERRWHLATRGGVAVAARGGGSVQQGGGSEAVAERCRLQRGGGSEGRWLRHSGSEWQRGGGSEAEVSKAVASNRW